MKKAVLVIFGLVSVGLLLTAVIFLFKSNELNAELSTTKKMLQEMQGEIKRVEADKEKIAKENEKLQANTVTYVSLNTDLQKDKDSLQERLKEAQKILENKEGDLQRLNQKLEKIEKEITKEKASVNDKLVKEKKELEEKISSLEATAQKERGLFHYNLGVAYTQARLYDEAVEAYEKSLTFELNNPEAHYNLGFLYADFKQDPEKAALHYEKYLELKPNAEDKEEVEAQISKLKGQ